MDPNEMIRRARLKLGMTQADAAQRSGLSTLEYADIEQHADEFMTNIELSKARDLCSVLGLDLLNLMNSSDSEAQTDEPSREPKNLLLKKYREGQGASIGDVAAAIGFEEEAVRRAEADERFLNTLPLDVLSTWAQYIGLPLACMLR